MDILELEKLERLLGDLLWDVRDDKERDEVMRVKMIVENMINDKKEDDLK